MGTNKKRFGRKVKQANRREARRYAESVLKDFRQRLQPKPKWIPKWLWMRLVKLVINLD